MFTFSLSNYSGSPGGSWLHVNVVINWKLAKQGIRWPVSPNCIAHSGVDLARSSTFLKLCAGKLLVFKRSQAQFYFLNVYMKHVVFMSRWPHAIKILISNQPRMRKFSQLFKNTGGVDLLLPGHGLVTLYVQFLCCDWSKFHRWVHVENLRNILKLVYFLWQLILTESCVNLWCF